jgi:hypothetical protein
MIDDDVLTAVRDCLINARDSVAGEQMATPAGDIITRVRRRRQRYGLAVAAAVVAVTALTLMPGSGSHGGGTGTTPVRLAAWTVSARPGGRVRVTIRDLRNPAGLQRQLRADGVPATVRFTSQIPRPCLSYPEPARHPFRLLDRIFPQNSQVGGQTVFTINPAAIPAPIGLWINVSPPSTQPGRHGRRSIEFSASWTLVYASGRCPSSTPAPGSYSGGGAGYSGEGAVSGPGN